MNGPFAVLSRHGDKETGVRMPGQLGYREYHGNMLYFVIVFSSAPPWWESPVSPTLAMQPRRIWRHREC